MVYVGESGTFTCNIGSTLYPAWQISDIIIFPEHNGHNGGGIYIPALNMSAADRSSTLTIEGTIDNNNTEIKCVAYMDCCTVDFSTNASIFTFIVYGELQIWWVTNSYSHLHLLILQVMQRLHMRFLPPPLLSKGAPSPPTDIELTPTLGTLLVSWLEPFSPLSAPSYQLEILYDNGTIVQVDTNSTFLLLTAQQLSCTPMQIRVFASNQVGRSNSSGVIDAFLISSEGNDGLIH